VSHTHRCNVVTGQRHQPTALPQQRFKKTNAHSMIPFSKHNQQPGSNILHSTTPPPPLRPLRVCVSSSNSPSAAACVALALPPSLADSRRRRCCVERQSWGWGLGGGGVGGVGALVRDIGCGAWWARGCRDGNGGLGCLLHFQSVRVVSLL
jgi:hypothetical protein